MGAEVDQSLLLKIGELIGQVSALHNRFNAVDTSITAVRSAMASDLRQHEERENLRFTELEGQLDRVKRLVWFGFGGVSAITTVTTLVLYYFNAVH